MRRVLLSLAAGIAFALGFLMLALLVYVGGELYLSGHGVETAWYETAAGSFVFGGAAISGATIARVCWRLLGRRAQGAAGGRE